MTKKEALKECIEQGNEYEYISYDGILDICDEDLKLVDYCLDNLELMRDKGEIDFDLDY